MRLPLAIFIGLIGIMALAAHASELGDGTLRQIRFDQKINAQIPLDATFRDDTGKTVRLGDYFGKKPVVLVLGYYGCPMLCTLVLNGLVETMQDLKMNIGNQFDVLAVSISPNETPQLAAAKKREYLRHYGRPGADAGWHFLTGGEPAIRQLSDAVGFRYAYDSAMKQYAHPSGFIVLTPRGKVSRYFFGVNFRGQELNDALRAASANRAGSPIRQLFLLCFHYSPVTGKYGGLIIASVRGIGIATLLALAVFVTRSVRGDHKLRP
jgi:protein SCO1/2